jgi:hypothetical protein
VPSTNEDAVSAVAARIIFQRRGRIIADLRTSDWPTAARVALAEFRVEATRLGAHDDEIEAHLSIVQRHGFLASLCAGESNGLEETAFVTALRAALSGLLEAMRPLAGGWAIREAAADVARRDAWERRRQELDALEAAAGERAEAWERERVHA